MKLATLIAFFTLIAAFILYSEYLSGSCVFFHTHFPLTVHIDSPSGRPVSVSCVAVIERETTEKELDRLLSPEFADSSAVSDPFDGQPLTVRVRCQGTRSWLGRLLEHSWMPYLAVVATMPDGRRIVKVVRIPDYLATKEVTVTLP